MTVTVKLYSGAIEGPTLLCFIWLFPYRIHSFRQLWNFHAQFKWRHAQCWRAFPKRQLFVNRRGNTQQNGCTTAFVPPSERRWVDEWLDSYSDSLRVPWLGHFCPQTYVSSTFSLLRNGGQNRPLTKNVLSGAARACQNRHRRASLVSQQCFGVCNAQIMWASEYGI